MTIRITSVKAYPNRARKIRYKSVGDKWRGTKVFFWVKDYNPIKDIFEGERYNKPSKLFRPHLGEIVAQAAVQAPGHFRMEGEQKIQASWSQYCGCRCPCSPGFRLSNVRSDYDISVEYEYVEEAVTV